MSKPKIPVTCAICQYREAAKFKPVTWWCTKVTDPSWGRRIESKSIGKTKPPRWCPLRKPEKKP